VGLWVVAELAKRGGAQVTLRASAYGGLLAIVLLPDRLIALDTDALTADISDAVPALAMAAVSSSADTPRSGTPQLAMSASAYAYAGSAGIYGSARPVPSLQNGSDLYTDPPDDTMNDPQPDNAEADPVPSQSFLSSGGGSVASPVPAARPPLPERTPQQHLAPELRDDNTAGEESAAPARSPEETRDRFAQYQLGWQAGRVQDNVDTSTRTD
jgi:hypothetical protein